MKTLTAILILSALVLTSFAEQFLVGCPECHVTNTLTPIHIHTNGGFSLPGTGSNGVWRTLEFRCIAKHDGKSCRCKFTAKDEVLVPEVKVVRVK
jgi:hypothetical protein